jgi:2-aminoethylphosphonate-pyruvate transaminase
MKREGAIAAFVDEKNKKAILSAGPGSLLLENLLGLEPCFGRADSSYELLEGRVLSQLRKLTGHDKIVRLNGSASLALEVAIRNFVFGRVLVVRTGYYAQRLIKICETAKECGGIANIDVRHPDGCEGAVGRYDWLITVYTETSAGYKNDLGVMRSLADRIGAQLMVDATGSIGLEDHHELTDIACYSSCKGLFGLTGASFIAYNNEPQVEVSSFYLDFATHSERKITGPYHAICSLDQALPRLDDLRYSVRIGKEVFCRRYARRLLQNDHHQPLLCTLLHGNIRALDENVVLYRPRTISPGTSIVCHLGEGHLGRDATGAIYSRIAVE